MPEPPDVLAPPLGGLLRSELEFLQRAIKRRQIPTPITEMALQSVGKGKLYRKLGPLAGAPREAALAMIEMALGGAEPGSSGPAAGPDPVLVWSGPDLPLSKARPTTAMLLELFASARGEVLVVGYEFDHGAVLFEPLHRVMAEHGVRVRICVDVRPAPSPKSNMDAYLTVFAHRFVKRNWPFGEPYPALYYLRDGAEHGSGKSLHAKCVVVDRRQVLVGSANFTKRGHSRNVEVGVRLEDAELAVALTGQFDRLIEGGDLAALPVAAAARELPPAGTEDEAEKEVIGAAAPASAEGGGTGSADSAVAAAEKLAEDLLVSDEAWALFVRLLHAGAPAPQVGEDIEGDGDEVIGSAELAWPAQKVAVLLPEQEGCRRKLEAADWTCFGVDITADELARLCELVAREQL